MPGAPAGRVGSAASVLGVGGAGAPKQRFLSVLLLCRVAGHSLSVPFACSRFQALPLARGAEWEGMGGSVSPAPFLLSMLTRLWRWGNHFRLFL